MRRSGYTLFETIVVMVILVVVGFIAIPAIQPMLTSNHLQGASDLIQARWTEMRTRAMADGRPYRFAVMENTGKFRIAPDGPEFWGGGGSSQDWQGDKAPWVVEEKLPGQIRFISTQVSNPGNDPSNSSQSSGGGSGEWTPAVTFLPNGTAREDVHVSLGQNGSRSITLTLRGLTGTITADHSGKGNHP